MADDPGAGPEETVTADQENHPSGPPEKMGPAFYAALALVGCLVLMVVVLNYPAARANAGTMMTQTNWTLQSLTDSTGILIPAQSGTPVTAMFDSGGRMNGNAGCNSYTSAYQTRDYSITISGTSSTKMFCQGPGVMEQESAFLANLNKASSFRVSDSYLKFYDPSGKTVLVFGPG